MSGQRAALPSGRGGLLRGSRAMSYGSLMRSSPASPVRQRHVEHTVQSGDTLQGLALKYGVSVSIINQICTPYFRQLKQFKVLTRKICLFPH